MQPLDRLSHGVTFRREITSFARVLNGRYSENDTTP
jgi:hypothetical protein